MGTAYGSVLEVTTAEAPPVVTSGLVAYYTFDNSNCNEARGRTEYNGVKQGNGNPVWSMDIPNNSGKSLQLSNDAYFLVPTGPIDNYPRTYSISLWLKTMTTNNTVVSFNTTGLQAHIVINSSNKINAGLGSWGYNAIFDIDISSLLLDGGWHLLTVIRRNSDKLFQLYIDGIYSANASADYCSICNPYNVPMYIGNGFTGKMDNVRFYNRELTQNEITEIYSAKQ
jgi:hypothetical protein